ncbi:MAG TPA: RpoL/Rpb11 RNA polymerase subunit family protein [Candidatus Poseidoniaceae archaeon]|jgi:DNA-directed RNA polymerase subunit L|nr:RpoL/Rpb11 RNA polymerase subunit family protein [Candidatus Poseidoniaceae archaeon]
MPIKVLQKEGNELKLRFEGESHTSLELFRSYLDSNKSVEYVNFFPGHPELDDPELYIRTKGKTNPVKLIQDACKELSNEFGSITLKE